MAFVVEIPVTIMRHFSSFLKTVEPVATFLEVGLAISEVSLYGEMFRG